MMDALDTVLSAHVGPMLAAAGFTRSGSLFRLQADNGDEALVFFHPFQLEECEAEFYIEAGVLPVPQAEWMTRDGGTASIAEAFWEDRLRSPANVLGLWQFDLDDTAMIDQMLAALRDVSATLVHLVDRQNLLDLVRDPATPMDSLRQFPRERALALLLSDLEPSEELRTALRAVEERNPDDPVAAWIRRRLAR